MVANRKETALSCRFCPLLLRVQKEGLGAKTTKTAFSQGYGLIFIGDGMVYGRPSTFSYWETSEKSEKRTATLRFESRRTRFVRKKRQVIGKP